MEAVKVVLRGGPYDGKMAEFKREDLLGSHIRVNGGALYKIVDGPIRKAMIEGAEMDHLALLVEFVGGGPA